MRILLGEISSYKAIVIAKYLKETYDSRDIEVMAYDFKPLIKTVHTRFVDDCINLQECGNGKETYVERLANCVRDHNVDLLIPVHSDFIGSILRQKELFGRALDYMGNYSDYVQLHEKDRLMELAKRLGVRIPIIYHSIHEANVPFVVKPVSSSSAKGVIYCMSEKDKSVLINFPEHMICQEYVAGRGCGYSVYCREGKILREYGHLRLAEFPISGGSSVYRTGFQHPQMRVIAERILSSVKWTGFAMFEFKLTPTGEIVLIEVNPRIWGSINQSLANGCMMFNDILENAIVLPYHQEIVRNDVNTCLWPHVWISALGYAIKNGDWSILKDYMKHNVKKDVSLLSDFGGFASMVIRKLV